jgi:hypothetical protein
VVVGGYRRGRRAVAHAPAYSASRVDAFLSCSVSSTRSGIRSRAVHGEELLSRLAEVLGRVR